MATSIRLIRRYVWLVDLIRRAGHITLDDINHRWLDNTTLNPDHDDEIPERTFHRHREAIADLFGVEIVCDRASNTYFIRDADMLSEPSFTSWLFDGLALDNRLMAHESVKRRIIFENTPCGSGLLPVIVDAMTTNRVLAITYCSYNRGVDTKWLIEPCGLKQYRRRWYLVGNRAGEDNRVTLALDRMAEVGITDISFEPDDNEEVDEMFAEVVGVFVDPDLDVEDVTVRVYGKQRRYFEGTPLHHSQKLIRTTAYYSDYQFRLRPEYEFQHEILRLGPDAEVLSPDWLRDDMRWYAEESLRRYDNDSNL